MGQNLLQQLSFVSKSNINEFINLVETQLKRISEEKKKLKNKLPSFIVELKIY